MATESSFTPEEWQRLERAPFVAGTAITLADPGGKFEAMRESMATLTAVTKVAREGGRGQLVDELSRGIALKLGAAQNVLADFQPRTGVTGEEMLAELRGANAIVRAIATREEADAFRDWVLEAAARTAQAAKEGGFLGIGAKVVGAGEQQMLDAIREALS